MNNSVGVVKHNKKLGTRRPNRMTLLLTGVVLASGVLVTIAISLYNSSGAAQLDLSGPRYAGVRDKIVQEKSAAAFPSSGTLDDQTFSDFLKAYDEHTKAIQQINGYDPAAVDNDAFRLTSPATQTPAQ